MFNKTILEDSLRGVPETFELIINDNTSNGKDIMKFDLILNLSKNVDPFKAQHLFCLCDVCDNIKKDICFFKIMIHTLKFDKNTIKIDAHLYSSYEPSAFFLYKEKIKNFFPKSRKLVGKFSINEHRLDQYETNYLTLYI